MRHLSLFTGSGGGEIAAIRKGWQTVGYVEYEEHCQQTIAQRIKDGFMHEAPIFGDIRTFISEGYADAYRGMVEVVSAGFPCTPFSIAGKRLAADDPANMWPQTIDVIRRVRPRYVWLENVPTLTTAEKFAVICLEKIRQLGLFGSSDSVKGSRRYNRIITKVAGLSYFGTILRELSEAGFDARWCVVSAADVGAHHYRHRIWVYATDSGREPDGVE